ncbi:MAG: EscU/YscU/HrcU family type III secretion system export apparatus switch protein [Gammaproteobacteria bacterium]
MKSKRKRPHPLAVALRWEGNGAPRVTAKGHGEIAHRILELADQNGVPLREDPALVEVLSHVDLGREIPVALYRAVAEVIAFAYSLRPDRSHPQIND